MATLAPIAPLSAVIAKSVEDHVFPIAGSISSLVSPTVIAAPVPISHALNLLSGFLNIKSYSADCSSTNNEILFMSILRAGLGLEF